MWTSNDDEDDYIPSDKGLYKSLCFMPMSYCLYSHERLLSRLPVLITHLSPSRLQRAINKHMHESWPESLIVHTYWAMLVEIEGCIHTVTEIGIPWRKGGCGEHRNVCFLFLNMCIRVN